MVAGLVGFIFSIAIAIDCASNAPIIMGNLRFASTSPKIKAYAPESTLLYEIAIISNPILFIINVSGFWFPASSHLLSVVKFQFQITNFKLLKTDYYFKV